MWAWPRDKTRILNHASKCGYLAAINKDLAQKTIKELARKNPGIIDHLNAKVGVVKKRTFEDLNVAPGSSQTVPLKRSRTEPLLSVKYDHSEMEVSESKVTRHVIRPGQNHVAKIF